MHAELLVLRLIHILSGIAWVGSGIFVAFFLIPALAATPPLMPQVMNGLQRRRVFVLLPTAGLLTILSGMRLYWIDAAGFSGNFAATGMGATLSVGAVAAFIAFGFQVFVSRPAGLKLGRVAAELAASPSDSERDRLNAEAARLRRRNGMATLTAVWFGIIAAAAMAIARYV
jgi:uncharacterized membrane protein